MTWQSSSSSSSSSTPPLFQAMMRFYLQFQAMKAEILSEYEENGLVTELTTYTSALQVTLDKLKVDATTLQVKIAEGVTKDTTDYTAVIMNNSS